LAYKYLSFDVELDGWLTDAPELTESERRYLSWLPVLRTLLAECEAQARVDGNQAILPLISRTRGLLDRWETCIVSRLGNGDAMSG